MKKLGLPGLVLATSIALGGCVNKTERVDCIATNQAGISNNLNAVLDNTSKTRIESMIKQKNLGGGWMFPEKFILGQIGDTKTLLCTDLAELKKLLGDREKVTIQSMIKQKNLGGGWMFTKKYILGEIDAIITLSEGEKLILRNDTLARNE